MSYSTIITAQSDIALLNRIQLALLAKAYARVDNVLDTEDQREKSACRAMFRNNAPDQWVNLVILNLDSAGVLLTAIDAQINAEVNAVWNRIKLLGV